MDQTLPLLSSEQAPVFRTVFIIFSISEKSYLHAIISMSRKKLNCNIITFPRCMIVDYRVEAQCIQQMTNNKSLFLPYSFHVLCSLNKWGQSKVRTDSKKNNNGYFLFVVYAKLPSNSPKFLNLGKWKKHSADAQNRG